ncbi:MAG: acyl-CoA dehydrogenase family protein [Gemmatimonadota bacterium]
MDFALTDEQRLLRDEIVRMARTELSPGARDRDREGRFSRELWVRCAEMGLQGLPVSVEYGGAGLDPVSAAIALEALGYGCEDGGLVFSLCAHLLACVVPVWLHGSEDQKRRWLPGLCDGSRIAVNAMTEPDSGSDAFAMQTRAELDGDGFRLRGSKTFSTNGPVADVALVYAVTDPEKGYHGGITAFIVETGASGFQRGQTFSKMGLRTSPIGEVVLDDVWVSAENVLGGVGAGATAFVQSMEWERTLIGACHVGLMQRLLERSIEYARHRTASGQPIGKFQSVSNRLVDTKVRLEASRLLVYRAASRLGRFRDVAIDASAAKLFVSEALVQTALDSVRTLGGYGFMVEYDAERALRDAVGGLLYSGTNDIQRNVIARWMGL